MNKRIRIYQGVLFDGKSSEFEMYHLKGLKSLDEPWLEKIRKNQQYLLRTLERIHVLAYALSRFTSGYRSIQGNQEAGGKADSLHLKGLAIDFEVEEKQGWDILHDWKQFGWGYMFDNQMSGIKKKLYAHLQIVEV